MSLQVNVSKNFGAFQLHADFEAAGGEVLGLLGASGCGKSMTLRCVAGIVRPDEGRIVLEGETLFDSREKINLSPQRRRVGLLFQNYALFPNMTVEQNIRAGLCREKEEAGKGETVARMMERLRLTGLEKRRPAQLSGGQQQRVALARILVSRPRLLMLDEPFSALDSYLRWGVELELTELLREFAGATLLVSHNRDEVYRLCDRVCVMDQGTSQPVVTVRELFDNPRTQAAALLSGCKNYAHIRPAGGARLEVVDWGVTLDCGRPVEEGVGMMGARSHYIRPAAPGDVNSFDCRVLRVIDDVFSTVILVRPETAPEGAEYGQIRVEMTKEEWAALGAGERLRLSIRPEDLLLLR